MDELLTERAIPTLPPRTGHTPAPPLVIRSEEIAELPSRLADYCRGREGDALFAMVGEQDTGCVATLQAQARALGVGLCGVIVPGIVTPAAITRGGAVIVTLPPRHERQIIAVPAEGQRTRESAIDAIEVFAASTLRGAVGRNTLCLFVDVTVPDIASLVDRVYDRLGDEINYAGASIGSETFSLIPCVFDEQRFLGGAALAIVLRDNDGAACAHHYAHHYAHNDALSVATATTGSCVQKIDGIPAFVRYQQIVRSEHDIELDRDNFYQYAVHFPFAMSRARGEPLVRIPVRVDEHGAVHCSGEIRENALLSVVRAVDPDDGQTVRTLADAARSFAQRQSLSFYCAGRLLHLGVDAAQRELDALRDSLATPALAGALCLGEIASSARQFPVFQNGSIVLLPWS
jgi:hypothetical protein